MIINSAAELSASDTGAPVEAGTAESGAFSKATGRTERMRARRAHRGGRHPRLRFRLGVRLEGQGARMIVSCAAAVGVSSSEAGPAGSKMSHKALTLPFLSRQAGAGELVQSGQGLSPSYGFRTFCTCAAHGLLLCHRVSANVDNCNHTR